MAAKKQKTIAHVVTQEDLDNNPELAQEGVKVGEEIQLPEPEVKHYYWLKVRSYVSDTEIWEVGLYQTDKAIPRLDRSRPAYVEHFEGEIPMRTLLTIADHYRVSSTKPSEILETLVIKK
jgi:hypothetical protein